MARRDVKDSRNCSWPAKRACGSFTAGEKRADVSHEGQLQVLDNSIDDGRVGEKSDDAHLTALMQNMSTAKLPH